MWKKSHATALCAILCVTTVFFPTLAQSDERSSHEVRRHRHKAFVEQAKKKAKPAKKPRATPTPNKPRATPTPKKPAAQRPPSKKPAPTATPTRTPVKNTPTPAPPPIQPTSTPRPTVTATPTPTITSTANPTATLTPRPTPTSVPSLPPLASITKWRSNMVQFGRTHCNYLRNAATADERIGGTYYDAILVYSQVKADTKDASWQICVDAAFDIYGREYVAANNGAIPGYWNFTGGFIAEYERSGSPLALHYLRLILQNGAYVHDLTPNASLVDASMSRENAYALYAKLMDMQAGATMSSRVPLLVDNALGHLDQWFGRRTAPFVKPFMVGLTARSLIKYWEMTGDNRVIEPLRRAAEALWSEQWLPASRSFKYMSIDSTTLPPTSDSYNTGGTEPAPDLNLIIAPMYAFLYHATGEKAYIEIGDEVFSGGVDGAFLSGIKQYNQNYFWSFEYLDWRAAAPVR